ncbi:MAG: hypothetical protein M0P71_13515 [Melioribacteraceae bacterium]|nr:hypothetical protein [Melioribacteraceae bacterium]
MAEIKIEKKKLAWLWVLLGIIVIALLVYFLVFYNYDEGMNETPQTSELMDKNDKDLISVKEDNSTVIAFINFVENDKNKMSLDHAYTNEALLKLVAATNAMAGEVGYDVQADLEKVKGYAEMITKDPFETTHADNIRKADDILANVLQNIQKEKYPGLTNEVTELKNASESIKPGILTLNQKNEVKTFFAKAADLLKKMN